MGSGNDSPPTYPTRSRPVLFANRYVNGGYFLIKKALTASRLDLSSYQK